MSVNRFGKPSPPARSLAKSVSAAGGAVKTLKRVSGVVETVVDGGHRSTAAQWALSQALAARWAVAISTSDI